MITSDRVVKILVEEGGYRELPMPMRVGTLSFDFTHVLVAERRANDIVIVVEVQTYATDANLVRQILAFTRALDVLHSKRSVTAVITSGQVRPEIARSLSQVCRVLPVGAPTGPSSEDTIRDWISVLLPIVPPAPDAMVTDWQSVLTAKAGADKEAVAFANSLIMAASQGQKEVERIFGNAVRAAVDPVTKEIEGETA